MARRKRSYTSGRNKIGVFLNNYLVEKERREREQAKEEERLQREEIKLNKRREKNEREEEIAARKALEKELKKQKKEQEQAQKKLEKMASRVRKVYDRLESDMNKLGLYANKQFLLETANQAIKLSVTPAQAKAYFITEDEVNVSIICAKNFLDDNYIGVGYRSLSEYAKLLQFVANYRPQSEAINDKRYKALFEQLNQKIITAKKNKAQKKALKEEQRAFIDELTAGKIMFKKDILDFWDIMENNNWTRKQALSSEEYENKTRNKSEHIAKIRSQIRPIKLQR